MEFLIVGIVTAFNIIVIMMKFNHNRESEAFLDMALFGVILWLTSGSLGGMIVGMIASAFISIYLYFSPPKFLEPQE